jgi:hypothetical protein
MMGLVVAAASLTMFSCSDSGSPTEPSTGIEGQWTGTFSGVSYDCEASTQATFSENRGSVMGQITVTRPCGNLFSFQGTFQGNTLEGQLTDFDGNHSTGRGIVSNATLEIHVDDAFFGSSRMNLHR